MIFDWLKLSQVSLGAQFAVVVIVSIGFYASRRCTLGDWKTILLTTGVKLFSSLGMKLAALQTQIKLSQRQLERMDPTKLRECMLSNRNISDAASVSSSGVLKFYRKAYNRCGLASSTLMHGEGKTLSCLQVLSELHKDIKAYGEMQKGSKTVFLYVCVSNRSISCELRDVLRVDKSISLEKVLESLTARKDGRYVVYGLIDQVEEWFEKDKEVLRCLVSKQYDNLHIHVPIAVHDVAKQFNDIDGGVKAKYLGPCTHNFLHDLTEEEMIQYVETLTGNNTLTPEQIIEEARSSRGMKHHLSPRLLAESCRALLKRKPDLEDV